MRRGVWGYECACGACVNRVVVGKSVELRTGSLRTANSSNDRRVSSCGSELRPSAIISHVNSLGVRKRTGCEKEFFAHIRNRCKNGSK